MKLKNRKETSRKSVKYCVCQRPYQRSDGPMVACDGGCSQWFHFSCLGFLPHHTLPPGPWNCETCQSKGWLRIRASPCGWVLILHIHNPVLYIYKIYQLVSKATPMWDKWIYGCGSNWGRWCTCMEFRCEENKKTNFTLSKYFWSCCSDRPGMNHSTETSTGSEFLSLLRISEFFRFI